LIIGSQKVPCQAQCVDWTGLDLPQPNLFLFLLLKSVFKGQQFAGAEEIAPKMIRALAEVSKNGFQESFMNIGKSVS
jgi:hypothetical protein